MKSRKIMLIFWAIAIVYMGFRQDWSEIKSVLYGVVIGWYMTELIKML